MPELATADDVPRDTLIQRVFGARRINDSQRARLRVEIGRLRSELADLGARPEATKHGYALRSERPVALLTLLSDDDASARLTMLLGGGAAWTAQGLAEHAGASKRTVQRALATRIASGHVEKHGREVRDLRPGTPVASRLLLLGLLPAG